MGLKMTRPTPKAGEIYRLYTGDFYQIICVGIHSFTGEKMVVFTPCYIKDGKINLYKDKEFYIKPLDLFLRRIDKTEVFSDTQEFYYERYDFESE